MSIFSGSNPLLTTITAAAGGGANFIEIQRSLRFNSADSAYLNRTPASTGNRKTYTFSAWIKIANLSNQFLFSSVSGARWGLAINSSGNLITDLQNTGSYNSSVGVYRDPSAWYHIVWTVDTTNSTAIDRSIIYVNGSRIADDNPRTLTQNSDTGINSTNIHYISRSSDLTWYLNAYLADVHFIDGQALDPTSFGEFDTNGIWQPIDASGLTYGTNGFHLPFSDNSSAAALGTDTSGNGNDWTVNNISVNSGSSVYSAYGSGTPYTSQEDWDKAFNGVIATVGGPYHTFGASNQTLTWTPPSPITVNTSATFYVYNPSNGSTYGCKVNGSYLPVNAAYGGPITKTSAELGGSITSIELVNSGLLGPYLTAVEVDGTLLVDGAAGDSLVDVPTNGTETDTGVGGEVRGNYATFNPLSNVATFTNGNLDASLPASGGSASTTIFPQSGKWYCEIDFVSGGGSGGGLRIGVINDNNIGLDLGSTANSWAYLADARVYHNGSTSSYGVSSAPGDKLMMALDIDAGKLWYGKNGTWMASGSPSTGSNPSQTFTAGQTMSFAAQSGSGTTQVVNANFGQRPFAYTAPSGFKALCTANLGDPVVTKPNEYMDVALYTGNGGTNTISGLGFSPDLVWIKNRNTSGYWHELVDSVRGVSRRLFSNDTSAEDFRSGQGLTSFNNDGFSLTYVDGNDNGNNSSGNTFVAWTWDAGNTTVTNNDGSITSQVRANPSAGFSIVSYTGSSSGTTVGHGLNAAPQMIIVKDRDFAYNWQVAHIGIGADESLILNNTDAKTDYNAWNNTRPTSSVFSLGAGVLGVNTNGNDLIAYCFAPVAGYSSFGSYTGNGSTDGPFVYTGFRPKFLLLKNADVGTSGFNWHMNDAARNPYNVSDLYLNADNSNAEASYDAIDFLSNGFKLRESGGSYNGSGNTHVFAAFAENPFALNARAR